jgi:hypothetical protein
VKLGEQVLARILAILACAGLIWAGIGFAGFALMVALSPALGLAGAAALAAAVLLIVPMFVWLLYGQSPINGQNAKSPDSVLSAISTVARERPLLAMIGAALFGAAEVLLSSRKKKN